MLMSARAECVAVQMFFAFCCSYFAYFSFHCSWTGKSISDSGNNAQEKPTLSDWMKQYLVAEIPPYCQSRESTDVRDVDRETEENQEGVFEDSRLPITPSGERESAQVMTDSAAWKEQQMCREGQTPSV